MSALRTVLICHEGAELHRDGLARWLASFSTLAGIVELREPRRATWKRAKREMRRSGLLGLADVTAFRLYYKARLARDDRAWERAALRELRECFPAPAGVAVLPASSPNSPAAEQFIRDAKPDLVLALCKTLLRPAVFSIPRRGTFVLHPGICPEYRNAHGCFWALACGDVGRVGVTLLRIDEGVDTGPVFGYFGAAYDEVAESHVVIQHRMVFDNLAALRQTLLEIGAGRAQPLDTTGRASAVWGQPRLTAYLRWKQQARRKRRVGHHAPLS